MARTSADARRHRITLRLLPSQICIELWPTWQQARHEQRHKFGRGLTAIHRGCSHLACSKNQEGETLRESSSRGMPTARRSRANYKSSCPRLRHPLHSRKQVLLCTGAKQRRGKLRRLSLRAKTKVNKPWKPR